MDKQNLIDDIQNRMDDININIDIQTDRLKVYKRLNDLLGVTIANNKIMILKGKKQLLLSFADKWDIELNDYMN